MVSSLFLTRRLTPWRLASTRSIFTTHSPVILAVHSRALEDVVVGDRFPDALAARCHALCQGVLLLVVPGDLAGLNAGARRRAELPDDLSPAAVQTALHRCPQRVVVLSGGPLPGLQLERQAGDHFAQHRHLARAPGRAILRSLGRQRGAARAAGYAGARRCSRHSAWCV